MKCNECQKALSAYYDNRLDKKEKIAVTTHLEECDVCQKEYKQFIKLLDCLKDQKEEITVPPLLHKKMLDKVTREAQKHKVKPLWTHRIGHIGGMVAALLVGVILIEISPLEMQQMATQDEHYLLSTSEPVEQSEVEETEKVTTQSVDQVESIQEKEKIDKEQIERETKTRMVPSGQNAELAVVSEQAEDMTMKASVDKRNIESTAVMQDETDSHITQDTNNNQEVARARKMNDMQIWQIETEHIDALTKYLEDYTAHMALEMDILQEESIAFIVHECIDADTLFNDLQVQNFTESLEIISETGENIKIIVKA